MRALEAKKSKVTAETTLLEAPAVEITQTDAVGEGEITATTE
jgi:hypothetical protein